MENGTLLLAGASLALRNKMISSILDKSCLFQDFRKSFEGTGKRPQLDPFTVPSDGLLGSLLRSTITLRKTPGTERPSLLVYGLDHENTKHEEKAVYKYIQLISKKRPGALYGTSGAGKTRSVLEYLSHNFGLYLSTCGSQKAFANAGVDPGSTDLFFVLKDIKTVTSPDESEQNLKTVADRMNVVIFVRHVIFMGANKILGGNLTPYEWLLLQLYPIHFFGIDIFQKAWTLCMDAQETAQETDTMNRIFKAEKYPWKAIFVDEAQSLLRKKSGLFFGEKSDVPRCDLSGIFKGLLEARVQCYGATLPYPIFAGTGMSMGGYEKELGSGIAKYVPAINLDKPQEIAFIEFFPFSEDGVVAYLANFLDLFSISKTVQKHLAKWLRGRPRWTATFVEEFLVRQEKTSYDGRKGNFATKEDRAIVQAMDRYLEDMTTKERRKSWLGGNRTAFTAFEVFDGKNRLPRAELNEIERVIYRFALGEKPELLTEDSRRLIEIGVAALKISETSLASDDVVAYVDEPLIVEAGINYYGLEELIKRDFAAQNDGGLGDGYEKLCIRPLQFQLIRNLQEAFHKNQFQYHISTRSAYGVVARSSKGQKATNLAETMIWLEQARGASFEGLLPPILLPDDLFGPDLVCLMWEKQFKKYRFIICQSKYKTEQSQREALLTLTPALFYHSNRGKTPTPSKQLEKTLVKNHWNKLQKVLDAERFVRVLMMYPASATAASVSTERLHKDSVVASEKCEDIQCKSKSHDWLYTIHSGNASEIFSPDVLRLLNQRKGRALDDNAEGNAKHQRVSPSTRVLRPRP